MKKLYCADDDPDVLGFVRLAVSKIEGVEITCFSNGLELYRAVQDFSPDGVICDIILPLLDGLAVARLMKYSGRYKKIPFLIISSVIDPDVEEQVRKVRADDFLRKPFTQAALRERVEKLLGLTSGENSAS
ncbi:MAG: response regulator [Candidatus Eremiobacteraeota bacterium]|nr:response regulator [Candidatus Eremiobacteraeota bacterium]